MEASDRRSKVDLVWASVFLAAAAMWALTVIVFGAVPGMEVVAAGLALSLLLAIVNVTLLLLFAGTGRALLIIGRLLVCLQLLCYIVVGSMGISLILRMP